MRFVFNFGAQINNLHDLYLLINRMRQTHILFQHPKAYVELESLSVRGLHSLTLICFSHLHGSYMLFLYTD